MACGADSPVNGDLYRMSYTGCGWILYHLSDNADIAAAITVLIFIGSVVFVLCATIHRMAWLDNWKETISIMNTRMDMVIDVKTMTVELKPKTVEKLRVIGKKGESYDDTIRHLMAVADYERFMLEQYKIIDEEDEWTSLDDL